MHLTNVELVTQPHGKKLIHVVLNTELYPLSQIHSDTKARRTISNFGRFDASSGVGGAVYKNVLCILFSIVGERRYRFRKEVEKGNDLASREILNMHPSYIKTARQRVQF